MSGKLTMGSTFAILPLVGLLGCSGPPAGDDTATDVHPSDWAVDEAGPFNVGFQSWDIDYELPWGETRTIGFNLWYPTEDTEGGDAIYSGLWPDTTGVLVDAPAAAPAHEDGYPVHVYSHGDQGFGGASPDLMYRMTTHGWVGIAPDHVGNMFAGNVTPTPAEHWIERPLDVVAALDALEAVGDGTLAGSADTSRVVVSGHSRGVYTVWPLMGATYDMALVDEQYDYPPDQRSVFEAGFADERIVAAIPMAGSIRRQWMGDTGHRGVHGPVWSMSGTMDDVGQAEQFETIDQIDFTWMELEGGCHQTFALGACSTMEAQRGFHIVSTYALAFSRFHVLADAGMTDVLDGSSPVDAAVTLQHTTP